MNSNHGLTNMSAEKILNITYSPDPISEHALNGWGYGQLWLQGQPLWFAGTRDTPQDIRWTWVDMLEHLAQCWSFLQLESPFPFPWIAEAMRLGTSFWQIADDRWEECEADTADEEESQLLAFANKHNLAAGWHGLSVPALYWYRQGHQVLLCADGQKPVYIDYDKGIKELESLGEAIALELLNSKNPRVKKALESWQTRNQTPLTRTISIITGLDENHIATVQNGATPYEYWDLKNAANNEDFDSNSLLAAARMTSASLNPNEIAHLLGQLRSLRPVISLPKLDDMTSQLCDWQHEKPYEEGYNLATRLRTILKIQDNKAFEPDFWLRSWGVIVEQADLGTKEVEAIAVWGSKGPAILVNSIKGTRSSHEYGYRFTLAHEMAHLLVDRNRTLSAAEVLSSKGSETSKKVEKRAEAFAAEMLLPRQAAAEVYRSESQLDIAVKRLVENYKVGRKVAKAQIKNSGAATPFDEEQIDLCLRSEF